MLIDLQSIFFLVSNVGDVLKFYGSLVKQVNKGLSLTKALRMSGKDFTTLRRIKHIPELSKTRPTVFKEVSISTTSNWRH